VDLLEKKIENVKSTAAALGVDVFVNARTDVYLQSLVPAEKRLAETISRAARYRSAGADGIFVPSLTDAAAIKEIVHAVNMPLNLLAWPGLADAATLANLGVRRLSAGSGIPQVIWKRTEQLAKEFLATGNSEIMSKDHLSHPELQRLFSK
jgi:2-methylisocitrate lyase-like PEP mutase family enzyme